MVSVTQPDSATLENLAMLADRALASEADVEECKLGVAEIKVDETTKLVGLLEDLSKRLKKLETATAAEKKRNQGRGRLNNHYMHLGPHLLQMHRPQSFFLTNLVVLIMYSKILVRSYRRRTHRRRKIMSPNRPTQPLRRFATTTKLSVKRRACAVNPVRTIAL